MIRESKQLQIGKAGEYLVCADLIMKGFIAFPSEQGLPYDLVMDNGRELLKIQVKTTEKPRLITQRANPVPAYIFSIKRAGKNGQTRYSEKEIDIFALVCLETMKIGYLKNKDMPVTINIRVDSEKGNYYDEKGIQDFKECLKLSNDGMTKTEISKKLNIAWASVNRYLKKGWKPYKTKARYFDDFKRDREWFL